LIRDPDDPRHIVDGLLLDEHVRRVGEEDPVFVKRAFDGRSEE
jgi:hypothetical protein